jgi:hypothetical protein
MSKNATIDSSHFGEIVWYRSSPKFAYWPCQIYDPIFLNGDIKLIHEENYRHLYVLRHFNSPRRDRFGFTSLNQVKDFLKYYDEFSKQKPKSQRESPYFDEACRRALTVYKLKSVIKHVIYEHDLADEAEASQLYNEIWKEASMDAQRKEHNTMRNDEIQDLITRNERKRVYIDLSEEVDEIAGVAEHSEKLNTILRNEKNEYIQKKFKKDEDVVKKESFSLDINQMDIDLDRVQLNEEAYNNLIQLRDRAIEMISEARKSIDEGVQIFKNISQVLKQNYQIST